MSYTKGVENTMNDSQRLLTSMLVTTISLAGLSTLETSVKNRVYTDTILYENIEANELAAQLSSLNNIESRNQQKDLEVAINNALAEKKASEIQEQYSSDIVYFEEPILTESRPKEETQVISKNETQTITSEKPLPPNFKITNEAIQNEFSEEEIYLICRVVESECYGADFDSKTHIADVIFNRVHCGSYGNDVTAIIKSPRQFYYPRTKISEDTIAAVEYAYQYATPAEHAFYFQRAKRSKWNGKDFMFKDDVGHCFYGDTYNVEDILEYAENIADAISDNSAQCEVINPEVVVEDSISNNSIAEDN